MDEPLTFDEILSDRVYQSEFDKRVTKALETAKSKWETDAGNKEAELYTTLGIKSKEDIPALVKKLNGEQNDPQKFETEQLNALIAPIVGRLEVMETINKQAKAELDERKQLEFLSSKEVPKEQLRYYRYEINQLVNDETSFEEAAAQFMTANPPIKRPPEFHVGSGRAVMTLPTTIDEYKKLSYDQKLELKEKNPGLYDKFKKMLGFK